MKEKPDKEKITKVAAALFAKKGYAATSIRDIAQALNVSVGGLAESGRWHIFISLGVKTRI